MGHEKADAYTMRAANIGTQMHAFCEQYLQGESPTLGLIDRYRFSGIIPYLKRIDPIHIEHSMWSNKLKVAGTSDVIGIYDGKLSIIDFKSTSRLKYDGDFDGYWMQCAAYAVMAYERLGLYAEDLVIIMQDISSGECNGYTQKTKGWVSKFKSIRDAYNDQSALLSRQRECESSISVSEG